MKILFKKRLVLLVLSLLVVPLLSFAQFSQEIANVTWNNPLSVNDISLTVSGTFTYTNPTPAPFQFQIEYGYPGAFTNQGGVIQIGGNAEVIGYGALLSSTGGYINPANNSFGITVNNLWPSGLYYFDILEWNTAGTAGEPLHTYYIGRVDPPENVTINLSPYQNGTSTLSGAVQIESFDYGVIVGMPVGVYLMSAPSNTDTTNVNDVLTALSMVVGANGAFSVPLENLQLNQQYYIKLVNEISGLPLMNSIPIMFNDLNTPPIVTPNNPPSNPGTNPGQLTTDEDFSNGLITCGNDVADGDYDCNFDNLLLMVNKVINFLIFIIGVPIVALTFAYAGFLLVTSGGNSAKKEEAKSAIGKAVVGLIIMLAAWLLVRTLLLVFGYEGPLLSILGVTL